VRVIDHQNIVLLQLIEDLQLNCLQRLPNDVVAQGIDLAVPHDQACAQFELPADRTGDIVVFSNGETVVGTRPGDHDLSTLDAPLRSHGGRSEQLVPMLANRVIDMPASRRLRNFDAFDIALNHCP